MSLKSHQMYTSQSLIIQVKPSFNQFPAHLFILIISHISSATVQLLKSIIAYSFLAHYPTLSAEVSFSICNLVNLCEKLKIQFHHHFVSAFCLSKLVLTPRSDHSGYFAIIMSFYSPLTEKAMAPHSSTPAWKIPWMEEPGRLQSMGSLRVRHD